MGGGGAQRDKMEIRSLPAYSQGGEKHGRLEPGTSTVEPRRHASANKNPGGYERPEIKPSTQAVLRTFTPKV